MRSRAKAREDRAIQPVFMHDPGWGPAMVRYVTRLLTPALGSARARQDAPDVVQAYLAACLEKGWLARDADDVRCFRAYLQTQLRRFCSDHLDRRFAAKPAEALSGVQDPRGTDAAEELDRGWIDVAVGRALATLQRHNHDYYEVVADLLRTGGEGSPDLAARMDRSPTQLVHLRHRARRRFAALFHDELRETVRDDEAFADLARRLEPHLP
jgi:DNA-directed RNA polymerase specialized sigma24 family protein